MARLWAHESSAGADVHSCPASRRLAASAGVSRARSGEQHPAPDSVVGARGILSRHKGRATRGAKAPLLHA